ncbi:MAG: autotransporter-associated beta strand repeat-containing protein [Kiritimatiellia bacterium]
MKCRSNPSIGLLIPMAALCAPMAMAATPVTSWDYYTATGSGDSSWVAPANTSSVLAIDWGTNGSGTTTTWGGINWVGSNANAAYNDSGAVKAWYSEPNVAWGTTYGDNTFYPSSSFPLLGSGVTGGSNHIAEIRGLTAGKVYKVQFVLADSRSMSFPDIGRTVTISGVNGTSGTANNYRYGYDDGRYAVVTANIVADVDGYAVFKPTGFNSNVSIGQQMNAMQVLAVGSDLAWAAGDGTWSNAAANWTGGVAWTDPLNNAIFNNNAGATAVTVSGTQTAGAVFVGNRNNNNATYTFSGGTINAASFTVQGQAANDPGIGNATLNNVTLNTAGNLAVGRWDLVIGGNSTVNIGGQLRSTTNGSGDGDWGRVTIQDSANVTAAGGVTDGAVFGLTLNGGTLTTPSIRAYDMNYAASSHLTFNGTTVVAAQDNASFVTVDGSNVAYVGNNGAKFDTNGKNITIGTQLLNLSGHSGTLIKSGTGTLTLTASNSITGGATVNGGTLATSAQDAMNNNPVTVNNGGVFQTNVDWGTGWSYGAGMGAITVNAGGILRTIAVANDIRHGLNLNGGTVEATGGTNYNWGQYVLESTLTVGGSSKSTITADLRFRDTSTVNVGVTGDPSGVDLLMSGKVGHINNVSWGYMNKSGAGTLKITGPMEIGGINLSAGKLILEDAAADWGVNATGLNNGAQVEVSVPSGSRTLQAGIYGGGSLVKTGAGTLTLTAQNSFSGGTTVSQGKLVLPGNGGFGRLAGVLTVNSGATVETTGDGTGLGFWDQLTTLNINGGTVTTSGTSHIWNLTGGINMTGAILQSNNGVSDAGGSQLEWNRTSVNVLGSATTSTIAGRIRMRGDYGYTGILFDVADGAAATDLAITAAITEAAGGMGITKNGPGTLVLSGNNSYSGPTTINNGLVISPNGTGIGDLSTVVLADSASVALQITGSEQVGLLSGGGASGGAGHLRVASGATLSTGENGGSAAYDGVISGSNVSSASAAAAPRPSSATTPSPAGWRSSAAPCCALHHHPRRRPAARPARPYPPARRLSITGAGSYATSRGRSWPTMPTPSPSPAR